MIKAGRVEQKKSLHGVHIASYSMIAQLEYNTQLAFYLCLRFKRNCPFLGDLAYEVTLNKKKSNYFLMTASKLYNRVYVASELKCGYS